jgi:hypothetical protein
MLTATQESTLAAVLDAFYPRWSDDEVAKALVVARKTYAHLRDTPDDALEAYFRRALDANDVAYVKKRIEQTLSPHQLRQIRIVLNLLGTSVGVGVVSSGRFWTPIGRLSAQNRENLMLSLATSRLVQKRVLFRLFQKMAAMAALGYARDGANSTWRAMGYASPSPALNVVDVPPPVPTRSEYDVVIVGSGAGGGVAAEALARSGLNVLVIEKGTFVSTHTVSALAQDGLDRMFERGGLVVSDNGSMSLMAGSTYGGGLSLTLRQQYNTRDRCELERVFRYANRGA